MENEYDVAIVGGGVPGLTLAGLLAAAAVRTLLIDPTLPPAQPTADDARTAAILHSNLHHLHQAGLPDPRGIGTPLKGLRLIDRGAVGHDTLFMATEIGRDDLGCNIALAALRHALYQALCGKSALTMCAQRVVQVGYDALGVTLTLADGGKTRAQLVVAADGRNSMLHAPAGIHVTRRDLGQMAITAMIEHSKPHEGISTEIHETGGPITFVPMEGSCSALVWVDKAERQKKRLVQSRAQTLEQIQNQSRSILGTLDLIGGLHGWPLIDQRADRLFTHRTALMAEAAHVIPPTGAQGLNLSLADAAVLGSVIISAVQNGLDPGTWPVLRRYADQRASDISLRSLASLTLNAVIRDQSTIGGCARAGMHRLFRAVPPIKHSLMRVGLGAV